MKLHPSIHITEDELSGILLGVLPNHSLHKEWHKNLAKAIVEAAKTKSLSSRSLYSSNAKMQQKSDKIKLIGRSETGIFAQLLLLIRRKNHHRGLRLIQPVDSEWVNLKETCKLATEFSNEFGLNIKVGYTEYLTIGISKMKNFSLFKFKSMHTTICNYYDCTQEIQRDRTPGKTTILYELYLRKVNERLGWEHNDYKENPEKYVCFVRAKIACEKFKIRLEDYIKAQFAAMEWGDKQIVPDPHQIYGDKAIERVRKYCYENNITMKQEKKLNFSKIKNG